MKLTSAALALAGALWVATAHAATYYVSPQGSDELSGLSASEPWGSIAAAVDRAHAGDTIVIMAGDYRERVEIDTPGLRLVGEPPEAASVNVIQTDNPLATDVEIVGITFTGRLSIKASGWLFVNCRFSSGSTLGFHSGRGTVRNALFVGRGSTGLKSYGADVVAEHVTIHDYGTAFYVSSGTLTVRDSIVGETRRVAYVSKRGRIEVSYTGFSGSEIPEGLAGAGNIVGPANWNEEFLIGPDSPFVDAGSRAVEETAVKGMTATWDHAPDEGTVDLGFHDGDAEATPVPPGQTPNAAPTPTPPSTPGEPAYFGFGSLATGGAGREEFLVTSLADSGRGTLRGALEEARRAGGGVVLFAVGGDIVLRSGLDVPADTTLDGLSAPPPGITLWGEGIGGGGGVLNIYESNVIVRGIRVRNAGNDGIQIAPKAGRSISDIVVDHCSVTNSADGGIDVTGKNGLRVTDLTISWNYLAGNGGKCSKGFCGGASLVKYGVSNISFHANFWDKNLRRNPGINGLEIPGGTLADLRNNLVRHPEDSGMQVLSTARANVIENYFEGSFTPVWFQGGEVFARGNVAHREVRGNVAFPFEVIGEPPSLSRNEVFDGAGTQPRDDIDNFYVTIAGSYSEVRANRFSP